MLTHPFVRSFSAGSFLLLLLAASLSACTSLTDPGASRFELEKKSRKALSSGNLTGASQLTRTLIAKFGPSPFLLNQRAVIEDRQGRPDMSIRTLNRAHHLFPENMAIALNLADAEVEVGQIFLAREILLPVLSQKIWPQGFRTLMGRIDLATGNLSESHIFLHEALSRHPDNPLILTNMGLLHRRLGLKKKAHEEFRKALSRAPEGKLKEHLEALLAAN